MIFNISTLYGGASLERTPQAWRRRFGSPPRGPFDQTSHDLANALLGNSLECSVIELSLAELTIQVTRSGSLAWVGSSAWQGVRTVQMGETVVFPYPKTGARSYLAGVDGFIVRGQTQSRNLRAGAEVNSSNQAVSDRTLEAIPPTSSQVRIVRGSHAGLFDFDRFLDMGYTIDIDSNRMGTRLNAPFPVVHSHELRSEPSDVGVIQMPGSGNPIILGPDGPTIGGYPRIAYVIRADLPLVAQLAPSQAVKFREVDLDEAMFLDQNASDSFRRTLALIKAQAAP